jgi:tetratricopeptide (TPR) repeat protein
LAAVLHQLRKFDDAIEVYGRALAVKKQSDGEDHFSVGHTLYNMACLHMDHGKLGASAELMRQALAIYELSFGADHQLTVDVDQQLRGLLQTLQRERDPDGGGEASKGRNRGAAAAPQEGDSDHGGSSSERGGSIGAEAASKEGLQGGYDAELIRDLDAMLHAHEIPEDYDYAEAPDPRNAHSPIGGGGGGPSPRALNRPTPAGGRKAQGPPARRSSLNMSHARVARATMPHIKFGTAI